MVLPSGLCPQTHPPARNDRELVLSLEHQVEQHAVRPVYIPKAVPTEAQLCRKGCAAAPHKEWRFPFGAAAAADAAASAHEEQQVIMVLCLALGCLWARHELRGNDSCGAGDAGPRITAQSSWFAVHSHQELKRLMPVRIGPELHGTAAV